MTKEKVGKDPMISSLPSSLSGAPSDGGLDTLNRLVTVSSTVLEAAIADGEIPDDRAVERCEPPMMTGTTVACSAQGG
ncbi:MAG: hypothetical protein ACLTXI_01640 [Collinsella sp.]